ncbi:MAG: hypothetical protein IPL32_03415 [Chloracidobacterium sp.]|nr:hypothetical protein [Chloracidobacterium sp.]
MMIMINTFSALGLRLFSVVFILGSLAGILCAQRTNEAGWADGVWSGNANFRGFQMGSWAIRITIKGNAYTVEYLNEGCRGEGRLEKVESTMLRFKETLTQAGGSCQDKGTVWISKGGDSTIGYSYVDAKSKRQFAFATLVRDRMAEAVMNPGKPISAEVTIRLLGVKVVDIIYAKTTQKRCGGWNCQAELERLPKVTAVQEGSPAYYAGVVPGDVIESAYDVRDNYLYTTSISSNTLASGISNYFSRQGKKIWFSVLYDIEGSKFAGDTIFNVALMESNSDRWISDSPTHTAQTRAGLPGVQEANTSAKQKYEGLKKESYAKIISNPCKISESQIGGIVRQLKALESAAADSADKFNMQLGEWENLEKQLNETAQAVCENSKDGGLTKLEFVLMGIALGKIQPCSYTPNTDYSSIYTDVDYVRFFSRRAYDRNIANRLGLSGMPEKQQDCFFKLIVNSM